MNTSESGIDFIIAHEGERFHVYKDVAGHDTIGVGHLLLPGESFSSGISEAQSRDLLRRDLQSAENLVNTKIKVPLTQNQFDALVSLAFNVPAALSSGTVDNRINTNASKEEISQIWLAYNKAGGVLVPGLLSRRQDELDMYFNSASFQLSNALGLNKIKISAKKNPVLAMIVALIATSLISMGIYSMIKS